MKPQGSSTGLWLPVTFLLSVSCSCAQARAPSLLESAHPVAYPQGIPQDADAVKMAV